MCEEKQEGADYYKMSLKCKIKYVVSNMTVEPVVACYIIPSVLAQIANQNLNLEKACRVNLKYSDEVCDALTSRQTEYYKQEETEVQRLVAGMAVWKTFIQSAIPGVLILFMGSWSDRHHRRKPFMLIPFVGEFLATLGLILCVYYFNELPMEVAGLVECIFPALSGGWMTMIMAVFSYIGDITTLESRTMRIGIVNIFISAAFPVGMSLSGILFRAIGFYGVFSISLVMYVFGFFWAFFKLKEPNKMLNETLSTENKLNTNTKEQSGTLFKAIGDIFDLKNIKETFITVFKAGEKNRRKKVSLLFFVLVVVIGPMFGKYKFIKCKYPKPET